ncbi:cell wall / vacuolar inhibitor of fructosidase 1-like [Silene latifolia]|uniref:cell wall / vacuolar inhibitor of fructosidase 1-like n=1 Tax=Silene latifolia TaxID=37657 RepID=UPI003D7757BA
MEKTLSCFIFFSLIAYNILFAKAQTNPVNLIDFTCKQTPDYNLCASTLNSDPRSRSAKDMKALATILVDHVNDKASSTRLHIATLFMDPKTDSNTKLYLDQCVTRYDKILSYWIPNAKTSMANDDYSKAQEYIDALPTTIELCERNFEFLGHVKSPITNDSKAMDDIAKVAIAVVTYKMMHPAPPSMN